MASIGEFEHARPPRCRASPSSSMTCCRSSCRAAIDLAGSYDLKLGETTTLDITLPKIQVSDLGAARAWRRRGLGRDPVRSRSRTRGLRCRPTRSPLGGITLAGLKARVWMATDGTLSTDQLFARRPRIGPKRRRTRRPRANQATRRAGGDHARCTVAALDGDGRHRRAATGRARFRRPHGQARVANLRSHRSTSRCAMRASISASRSPSSSTTTINGAGHAAGHRPVGARPARGRRRHRPVRLCDGGPAALRERHDGPDHSCGHRRRERQVLDGSARIGPTRDAVRRRREPRGIQIGRQRPGAGLLQFRASRTVEARLRAGAGRDEDRPRAGRPALRARHRELRRHPQRSRGLRPRGHGGGGSRGTGREGSAGSCGQPARRRARKSAPRSRRRRPRPRPGPWPPRSLRPNSRRPGCRSGSAR